MGALISTWQTPRIGLLITALWIGMAACQPASPVCPERTEEDRLLRGAELQQALLATPVPYSTSTSVDIGGRQILVDRVVTGPLCNDDWRGTIYVGCDVRVPEWIETPTFLSECQLEVEPGTVVYVAAHNNTAYYQGCSCHTGEIETP